VDRQILAQIKELRQQVAKLTARQFTGEFDPAEIERQIADLQAQIDALEASLSALSVQVANLSIEVADIINGGGTAATYQIRTVTADTTNLLSRSWDSILVDCTAGDVNVDLTAFSGQIVTIKKTDNTVNVVNINGVVGALIDGQATQTILYQWTAILLQSDGTDWFIS
jgi:hypothetical protein